MDWWKGVSHVGHRQEYTVSIAGATEKFNVSPPAPLPPSSSLFPSPFRTSSLLLLLFSLPLFAPLPSFFFSFPFPPLHLFPPALPSSSPSLLFSFFSSLFSSLSRSSFPSSFLLKFPPKNSPGIFTQHKRDSTPPLLPFFPLYEFRSSFIRSLCLSVFGFAVSFALAVFSAEVFFF